MHIRTLEKTRSSLLERLKRVKMRLSTENLRERIARNLYNVFVWMAMIEFLIASFGTMGILYSSSKDEVNLIFDYSILTLGVLYLFFCFFNIFYTKPKIISKLESLSPMAQYNVLKIGRKPFWLIFLGFACMLVSLIISAFMNIMGLQEFVGNEVIQRIFACLVLIGVSFVGMSVPMIFVSPLPTEKEMEVSLDVIQDFEDIAIKVKELHGLVGVWKRLVKNIIYGLEGIIKRHIGVSDVNFYKPFNVISLAAIMGNSEQVNKAKEWIRQLSTILMNKELMGPTKAELILSHMEQVKREFPKHLRLYERYDLNYKLESRDLTRSLRTLGTVGKFIIGLATIGSFIVVMVRFLLRI